MGRGQAEAVCTLHASKMVYPSQGLLWICSFRYNEAMFKLRVVYFLIIFLLLILKPGIGEALSCKSPDPIIIAICDYEEKECRQGFTIEYRRTGNRCHTVPVVTNHLYNLEKELFVSLNQNTPHLLEQVKGTNIGLYAPAIYEFKASFYCLTGWQNSERNLTTCRQSLNKISLLWKPALSDSFNWWSGTIYKTLENYRKNWLSTSTKEQSKDKVSQAVGTVIIVTIGMFVLFIPKIIGKLSLSLRQKPRRKYIISILSQSLLGSLLFLSLVLLQWSYPLWGIIILAVLLVTGVTLLSEITYLIYLLIKKTS